MIELFVVNYIAVTDKVMATMVVEFIDYMATIAPPRDPNSGRGLNPVVGIFDYPRKVVAIIDGRLPQSSDKGVSLRQTDSVWLVRKRANLYGPSSRIVEDKRVAVHR